MSSPPPPVAESPSKAALVAINAGELDTLKEVLTANAAALPVEAYVSMFLLSATKGAVDAAKIVKEASMRDLPKKLCDGVSPLYMAAQHNQAEFIKYLVKEGADVNLGRERDGMPPLSVAVRIGAKAAAEALVSCGADCSYKTRSGATPMGIAAHYGVVELAEYLLSTGKVDVNQVAAADGATPLIMACRSGVLASVQLLVEHGAEVQASTVDGVTPLLAALQTDATGEMVALLLEKGADVKAVRADGATPLYLASYAGMVDLVKKFLEMGGDPNACKASGAGPLFVACQNGHFEVVQVLLEAGARVDQKVIQGGVEPLGVAAQEGRADIVKILLEHGAKVDHKTENEVDALYLATQFGRVSVVKELLEHGATPDARSFYVACARGFTEIVSMFIDSSKGSSSGLDINEPFSENRTTPLLAAAGLGFTPVVELLLANGADKSLASVEGTTPLEAAKRGQFEDIIKLLE